MEYELDINTSENKRLGRTQFEALYGFRHHFIDGDLIMFIDEDEYQPPMNQVTHLREKILRKQKHMKQGYNRRKFNILKFEVGV